MPCVSAVLLAGCAKSQYYEEVKKICVPEMSKLEAMQAAEDVLGKMHFTIAKVDAEQGIIRTRPLAGAQFFEFWRKDNVGAFNTAEANLHSIRRIVQLDIHHQDGQICIGCDVRVQRLNLSEREVHSSGRTYRIFSDSSPLIQTLQLASSRQRDVVWVDLDKDSKLSTKILRQIEKQLAKL